MKASHPAQATARLTMIVIIAVVCTPMLLTAFLDVVPTRNASSHFLTTTEISLVDCKREIQRYAIKHNALPSCGIKDSWGHLIRYGVDSNGMVTLSSYGKDNKPGGTGDDADMVGVYPSRQPNGHWSDECVKWTKEPYDGFETSLKQR
jgi:hypothetical protein